MPDTAMLLKVLRVLLEYGMLFWLLMFVGKISRWIFLDMKEKLQEQKPPELQSDEAVLEVLGSDKGEEGLVKRRFAFSEQITLGRGEDNDVVIPESFVSHHHAVLFRRGSQYVIEDLGSRNHTYVNDQLLTGKAYIKPGDTIRIGLVTMRFER